MIHTHPFLENLRRRPYAWLRDSAAPIKQDARARALEVDGFHVTKIRTTFNIINMLKKFSYTFNF